MDYKHYATQVLDFEPSSISGTDITFLVRLINSGSTPKISSYLRLKRQPDISKNDQLTARKLLETGVIQIGEGKLFSGSSNYRLTEVGIFYVLSKLEEYPPSLLIKYSDSNVLETLIYQFFEVQTIKRCTASLYSEITRYLKECSTSTISRLDSIKYSKAEDQLDQHIRQLQFDLTWLAKILVLKLAMIYSESNILRATAGMTKDNAKVALYELENDMKGLLSKDSKFKKFLGIAHDEMIEGYEEIRKRSELV